MALLQNSEIPDNTEDQRCDDLSQEGDFDESTGKKVWAIFHEEYFRTILGYKGRRAELREKTDRVMDQLGMSIEYGSEYPTDDIDPFTLISRITMPDSKHFEKSREGYEFIKKEFGLSSKIPSDNCGLPKFTSSPIFSHLTDLSWEFFESALNFKDDQSESNRARFIAAFDSITRENRTNVGAPKATLELFSIDPYFYPPLNSYSRKYYREKLRIVDGDSVKGGAYMKNVTGEGYLGIKEAIMSKYPDKDFRRIAYEAWIENQMCKESEENGLFDDIKAPEGLSEDGRLWLEILKDSEVSTKLRVSILKHFAERGGSASYRELSKATGYTPRQFESNLVNYGKDIIAKYDKFENVCDENHGPRFIFFNYMSPESGTDRRDNAVWILKPEIMEVFRLLDGIPMAYGNSSENDGEPSELEEQPRELNVIFYGPPGTGKTFHAKRRAVEIVSGKTEMDDAEYSRLFDKYRNEGSIRMVTFHQSYSYEDFICGICPSLTGVGLSYRLRIGSFLSLCYPRLQSQIDGSDGAPLGTDEIEKERPRKRRVLIIDEINRGNVSSIFGELMTLIESSKRLENPDQAKSLVPSLSAEIGIPNDVYLIGTMNTADKSLVYLDAALRRRFRFVEMTPREDLVGDADGIKLGEILRELNRRIEVLLDRDHTIGHSEFMAARTLDDVRNLFAGSVIPLLQDYFFDDYGRIVNVLSRKGNPNFSDFFTSEKDDSFGEERRLYRLTPRETWTASTFNGIAGKGDES